MMSPSGPILCLVAVATLSLPSPTEARYPPYSSAQAYPASLRQTLIDILVRKILQTSLAANVAEKEVETVDEGEALEEASDSLTAVTRYVGVPYHLLKGSPDGDFNAGGIDPGIMATRNIFEFTYNDGKTAYRDIDGKTVSVPDQVNFQPQSSCSRNRQKNLYSGAKSYQKSLDFGLNAGATVYSFRFGLSGAIKKAESETAGSRHVFLDSKQICNLGQVRYLTDAPGIHQLSPSFINRVKNLQPTYNVHAYMKFIRDWGTHFIVQADVGTKNITRSSLTYNEVYQQLKKQKSGGIKLGGEFSGNGGQLELDIGKISLGNKNSSSLGRKLTSIVTGTPQKPYPIKLTLRNISEALRPEFWTALREEGMTYSSLGIAQKKANLERALADYADYEGVGEITDPAIKIPFNWPDGQYALPATRSDCPKHWSRGIRTQGTGSNYDWSSGIHGHLDIEFNEDTIKTAYCVKTDKRTDAGFDWPEGSYCIARKGGSCPPITTAFGEDPTPRSAFREGNITWNDKKSRILRKSENNRWGELPDGEYDKDTTINFCCRSDGSSYSPMLLPIGQPFALYRYGGTCQQVNGTTVQEDFVTFDSQSLIQSKNACAGAHPDLDDERCKEDHTIHLCYYKKAL